MQRSLTIEKGTSLHVITSYVFALKHLESLCIERMPQTKVLSRNLAEKVCSLKTLKELKLQGCNVPVSFSNILLQHSKDILVETFILQAVKLSKNSSISIAKCISFLPHLKNFELSTESSMEDFLATLHSQASQSKITSLSLKVEIIESESPNLVAIICALPCLKDLKLVCKNLSDEFFCALRQQATSLKITTLEMKISESVSPNLVASICALPCLKDLKLDCRNLSDEIFCALREKATSLKVESLDLSLGGISELGSQSLAASICSMPCLRSGRVKSISNYAGELKATLLKDVHIGESSPPSSPSWPSSSGVISSTCQINIKMNVELLTAFVSSLAPSKTSKIESLDLSVGGISELGLQSLAASICSLPCLRSVRVHVRSSSSDQGALKATLMKDVHVGESLPSPPPPPPSLPSPSSSSSSSLSRVIPSTCQINIKMNVELLIAFVSSLAPSKTSKVESLEIYQRDYRHDISKSTSHSLGVSICTMPCLKNFKLAMGLSDEFYTSLREGALSLKVESLDIHYYQYYQYYQLSESASQNLGVSICTMACLKNLELNMGLSDGFYTALREGASSLKIESLDLSVGGISELGLQSLAASICSLPCLRSVRVHVGSSTSDLGALKATLMKDAHEDESSPPLPLPLSSSSSSRVVSSTCQVNIKMDVELLIAFVSFLVPSKTAKVESLEMHQSDYRHDISKSASHNLGASICTMPCLENLKLALHLSDVFYTALRKGAPSLKVKTLEIKCSESFNESASQNLGASICIMPCLMNVKLAMNLSDEFYTALREGASSLKIEQMHWMGVRLERSDGLSAFALMQNLVSLTLFDVRISNNSKHTEEEGRHPSDTPSSTSLTELNVDYYSFISLCGISLQKRFPHIQKMTLAFHDGQTPFPQKLFHHVTVPAVMDLTLHGYSNNMYCASLTSLSLVPLPNLINLSLINIRIGNDNCKAILGSLRYEKTLKTISIKDCATDADLDSLCNEINAEGKMTVTVQHGESELIYRLADVFRDIKSGAEDLQVMSQDDES